VRIERVVLEHHRDVALLGRQVVDDAVLDPDLAAGDALEPRHHPQKRRLSAARRADQHDELAIGDVDRDAMQHVGRPEALGDVLDFYRTHACWHSSHGVFSAARCAKQGRLLLTLIEVPGGGNR
jgi:hypothetical protein